MTEKNNVGVSAKRKSGNVETKTRIWSKSRMDSLGYDGSVYISEPCEIKLSADEIVVSFKSEGQYYIYRGASRVHGHYVLIESRIST